MRDEVEDIHPGDALLLKQEDSLRIALLVHSSQDIATVDCCLPGRLCLQSRPLQNTLEGCRLLRHSINFERKLLHVLFEKPVQLALQLLDVASAVDYDVAARLLI